MSDEIDFLRHRIAIRQKELDQSSVLAIETIEVRTRLNELKSLLWFYENGYHLAKPPEGFFAPCPECNGLSVETRASCERCHGAGKVDFRSLRKTSWQYLAEE